MRVRIEANAQDLPITVVAKIAGAAGPSLTFT